MTDIEKLRAEMDSLTEEQRQKVMLRTAILLAATGDCCPTDDEETARFVLVDIIPHVRRGA